MPIDFGKTVPDYARFRAGFPNELFDRLRAFGVGLGGQHVVDLGAGTGALALGFAERGCTVTAVDVSAEMIASTLQRAKELGFELTARIARAEDTGLPSASADAVVAGQCWHWFDRDAAACEAYRLLKPGGALAILHRDWVELPNGVTGLTDRLIEQANPSHPAIHKLYAKNGLYGAWLEETNAAGFKNLETFSFDADVPFTHQAWRGRIRSHAGIGASLSPDAVDAFDRALERALAERFPEETLQVPHRVFALVARR